MLPWRRNRSAARFCRRVKGAALGASLVVSAGAVAIGLAFPSAWWLTWFALVPLFLSIRVLSPPEAMLGGVVWGLWVYIFSVFALDTGLAATPDSLVLLVAIPASYTYLAALLTRRIGYLPLVLAYGWMGVEFALSPLGLQSGLLGAGDGLLADSVGRLLGYILVAFLLAAANASVIAILSNARLSVPPRGFPAFLRDCGGYHLPRAISRAAGQPLREAYPRGPPIPVAALS